MAEEKQFDFYREALKAFDVPLQQPKEEVAAPPLAESDALNGQIVMEAERKPTPKRNKWRVIAICAVLLMSLLICFWPGDKHVPTRGENWIYGTYSISTEDRMIITDLSGVRWYVELNGVEQPQRAEAGTTQLWVFYNGEPQETSQLNCTKKITASTIRTADWYTVLEYAKYGRVYDEIDFDLDDDGEKEHWLVCASAYTGFGTPYLDSTVMDSLLVDGYISYDASVLVISYRLVALDSQGNEKYHVRLTSLPLSDFSHVIFSDQGGVLSLISQRPEDTLQISIDGESLSVSKGEKKLDVRDLLYTEPTEEYLTISTMPQTSRIQFVLGDGSSGDVWDETEMSYISGSVKEVGQHGILFKNMLDDLTWTSAKAVSYRFAGYFVLTVDEVEYSYKFTHTGMLVHQGKYAKMSAEVQQSMVALMGYTQPQSAKYFGETEDGTQISLVFSGDGTFSMLCSNPAMDAMDATRIMSGRYGTVQDYLYLCTDALQPLVLVLQDYNTELIYWEMWNNQQQFALRNGARLCDSNRTYTAVFSIPDQQNALASGTGMRQSNPLTMNSADMRTLQQLLDALVWMEVDWNNIPQICGAFSIFQNGIGFEDAVPGVDRDYYFTKDGKLIFNGLVAEMSDELKQYLTALLLRAGEQPLEGRYVGENRDGRQVLLALSSADGSFTLFHPGGLVPPGSQDDMGETWGSYVWVGDVLRLYYSADITQYIQLRVEEDGSLIYMDKLSNTDVDHRLPDGAVFQGGQWPELALPDVNDW